MSDVADQNSQPPAQQTQGAKFPIIGLGASAGGLQALKRFFEKMPAESGMAFVVIMHLSPQHESHAAEILQNTTRMTVTQVTEVVRVEPNHVYVIPPIRHLAMADGYIRLSEPERRLGQHVAVDLFFRTLANTHQTNAVCIVLSGTGADGSVGIKHVKEAGGIAIAQDPQDAEYEAMPRNAINTGMVDFVLPVVEMPEKLIELWRNTRRIQLPVEADTSVIDESKAMTVEKLKSSNEEMQSVDKELRTVNQELKNKVEEVSDANDDLKNLMASTGIAMVFLNRALCIKRYTPRALDIFNFIPTDEGRQLTDITHRLDYTEMRADAERVLSTLQTIEREVVSREGRHFLARLAPYHNVQNRIDGVVMSFIDITERKRAEDAIAEDLRGTQILQTLAVRLVTEENIQTIYDEILVAAIEITRADAGTVQMFEAESEELVFLASRNISPEMIGYFCRVDASSNTPCGIALRTGARSFMDFDQPGMADEDGSMRRHVEGGLLSAQSTPLLTRSSELIGILSTHWRESGHRPTERELRFLDLLARQAADLIEQRLAEESLRESEEKYRMLFDSMDEGYILCDVIFDEGDRPIDILYLDANPAAVRMTGMELAGKTTRQVDPNFEEHWFETWGRVAKTGVGERHEYTAAPLDVWYNFYVFKVGTPEETKVAAVYQDITERKRTEETQAFLLKLSDALRPLNDPVVIQKTAMKILGEQLGVHRAFYSEVLDDNDTLVIGPGYTNEVFQLTGQLKFSEFEIDILTAYRAGETIVFNDTHSDARVSAKGKAEFDAIQMRAAVGVSLVKDERVRAILSIHQSVPRQWTKAEIALLKETAERTWAAVERAEAEEALRESEGRLQAMVENLPGGAVFIVDRHLRYLLAQGEAFYAAGFEPPDFVGKTIFEALPVEIAASYEPRYRQALAGEEFTHEHEAHGRTYSSRGTPLRDASGEVSAVLVVSYDISDRKRAEEELMRAHAELERRVAERTAELSQTNESLQAEIVERQQAEAARALLLRCLISAQEEERSRLARELHDQFGQQLIALKLNLDLLKHSDGGQEQLREQVERVNAIASQLDKDVDFLVWELRPTALDDLGLVAGLQSYINEWSKHTGAQAQFHYAGMGDGSLTPEVETCLYRIAQEALNNISKHAEASQVSVILERRKDVISLIIEDDGKGFDTEALKKTDGKHFGVMGMRERAALIGGTVEIETHPGDGATIFVRVPIASNTKGGGGQVIYHKKADPQT